MTNSGLVWLFTALAAVMIMTAWPVYRLYRVGKVCAWAKQQGWTCLAGQMFHPQWFYIQGPGWEMRTIHRQSIARNSISFTVWRWEIEPTPQQGAWFCGPRPERMPEPLEFGGMLIQVALQLMIAKNTAEALAQCRQLDFGTMEFRQRFIVCGNNVTSVENLLSASTQALLASWPDMGKKTYLPVMTYADGVLEIRVKTWLIHPQYLAPIAKLGESILAGKPWNKQS